MVFSLTDDIKKNIWNEKELNYTDDLEYDDFVVERDEPVVVKSDNPVNEGDRPTWSFKNLLTKDVGSDIYLARITFPEDGGHDYHAHSGWEIIYVLSGKLQSTYRSTDGEDVQSILEPGDVIFAPHGTPHSVWNAGEGECEFLVMKMPPYFLEGIPLPEGLEEKSFKPER